MEPSASPSASTILPIEIGSLSASSPNESQFFGSSSGVFFVNTVFRAFAASRQGSRSSVHPTQHTSSPGQASVDNCIVDQSDDFLIIHDEEVYTHKDGSLSRKSYGVSQPGLGRPPSVGIAKELIISYFEKWHPLFPFLHGPTILEEVELFYSNDDTPRRFTTSQLRENTRRAIIFQCIFNIAALDRPDITLSPASKIESPASLMSFLGILAVKHDTPSLQALLAAQLYLMAVMALQAASTVGGMLVRNIFHAGFHRCPARYVQLSGHDCDIRKRIFWCVYATDRYLSQSLGHPVSIQDKDLDVCIPGTKELHRTVPRATPAVASRNTENEVLQHLPNGHPASSERLRGRDETQSTQDSFEPESSEVPGDAFPQSSAASKIFAEGILANYVGYCRVTGRILDLFHKSIQNRSVENDNILVLTSEVHEWWNSLPQELQDYRSIQTGQAESLPSWAMKFCSSQGPFFTMIYQQLILLINRPFLSMDPAKPAFRSSLQTCISASRTIISTLKQVISHKQCISLPGTLSSAWMSGLVIAFACELSMYPFNKGILEIESCLEILHIMGKRWNSARHCHSILEILLADLQVQNEKHGALSSNVANRLYTQSPYRATKTPRSDADNNGRILEKRQRLAGGDARGSDQSNNIDPEQPYTQEQNYAARDLQNVLDNSALQGVDFGQVNELQWSDVFGQVSWEALFNSDNTGEFL